MGLDFAQVVAQIASVMAGLRDRRDDWLRRREAAWRALDEWAPRWQELREKVEASKTSFLAARLLERMDARYPASAPPPDFAVAACDGSHIDVDRHAPVACYLLNMGKAVLCYGSNPDAELSSEPALFANEEDLTLVDPKNRNEAERVEGILLGVRRSVREAETLADLVARLPAGLPCLAILDGSLVLFALAGRDDRFGREGRFGGFVREALLNQGLLRAFDRLRDLGRERPLALASYISAPRSTEVVSALRIGLCPAPNVNCDRDCRTAQDRACDVVAGVQDAELFARSLAFGERSAVFASRSSIVRDYYAKGGHEIRFFYLRLEDEVARVEIPRWVAEDDRLLALTHSLLLEQCRRGLGYPVALSEAHEQAVVTGADRELFWQLVGDGLMDEGRSAQTSAKSRSKRVKWN